MKTRRGQATRLTPLKGSRYSAHLRKYRSSVILVKAHVVEFCSDPDRCFRAALLDPVMGRYETLADGSIAIITAATATMMASATTTSTKRSRHRGCAR